MKSKILSFIFISLFLITPVGINADDESSTVILGGEPFGIKMFSDGVLVIKTQDVATNQGERCPADEADIQPNDVIITAQGEYLKSNEQLADIISRSEGESIDLKLKRNEKYISTSIEPVKDVDGIYRIGIWVRDSAAGIGTITCYSREGNGFCGLGHGICDKDTGALMTISSGEVDSAYISSVTKSVDGNVGTLNGYFTDEYIGKAITNSDIGIYGKAKTDNLSGSEIEVASEEDIELGSAYVYTSVYGNKPKPYEVIIEKIFTDKSSVDMVVRVTDAELLEITGGIVQGMSGSPIVQNNKLVGAVTHVMVDDVDCGYGISAQTMVKKLDTVCN